MNASDFAFAGARSPHLDRAARRLADLWKSHARVDCLGVSPHVAGWLLARLDRTWPNRNVVVLCADQKVAEDLSDTIQDFVRSGENAENDAAVLAGQGRSAIHGAIPEVAFWDHDDLFPGHPAREIGDRGAQAARMALLYAFSQRFRPRVVVSSIRGLMEKVPPRPAIKAATEWVAPGLDHDRDAFTRKLVAHGYQNVKLVESPGDFAVRGAVLDVFSPLLNRPVRLEYAGNEVVSIRSFDPVHQKTLADIPELHLPPVRPVPMDSASISRFLAGLDRRRKELDHHDRKLLTLEEEVRQGVWSADLDLLMPLFHDKLESFVDHLPTDPLFVVVDPLAVDLELERLEQAAAESQEKRRRAGEFTLPTDAYLMEASALTRMLANHKRMLVFPGNPAVDPEDAANKHRAEFTVPVATHEALAQAMYSARGTAKALDPLVERLLEIRRRDGLAVIHCDGESQRERLKELLTLHQVPVESWTRGWPALIDDLQGWERPPVLLMLSDMRKGFDLVEDGLSVFCEEELFGREKSRTRNTRERRAMFTDLADEDMADGDIVVHEDYGVGVYRGLTHMSFAGQSGDFVQIDYQGTDKLYLPITRLDKVRRYGGEEGKHPPIDRLGGSAWSKVKAKVRESVLRMAQELLQLYAKRQTAKGDAFAPPDEMYRQFEQNFPYDETPDQLKAIEDVIADMVSGKAMDRLVCGDVGFGKTEVAVRAAFLSAIQGRQVCVLVPTTVLALQHGRTFQKRFQGYPIRVESISRFQSNAEVRRILEGVKSGHVDVLVGTHRLLHDDVKFRDLGLLVVDEEQRFGVKHKERIKAMKNDVAVLTLTATPIPRTLHMAFVGLRDMSLIATPPADRHAIRTYLSRFDEGTIKEAIEQELNRGGQVFVLHNRIGSIEAMAGIIKRLVPQARVGIAHGQMKEEELEPVILDFMNRQTNVLVCTNIIEAGVDIPNANTIIVNRADTFGLSQLYQIRGRVGRGKERAHCYLLVPPANMITKDAQKRLSVLMRFTELGSGFKVAHHDLEIRGAGTLLGEKQWGHINQVGVDLYMELLEEAIAELKGESAARAPEPEISVSVPAFIPEVYMPDQGHRLTFYRKLNQARTDQEVDRLANEMRDRFGPLPSETTALLKVMDVKNIARRFAAQAVDILPGRVVLKLGTETRVDPMAAAKLVQSRPKTMELTPAGALILKGDFDADGDLLAGARRALLDLERELARLAPPAQTTPPVTPTAGNGEGMGTTSEAATGSGTPVFGTGVASSPAVDAASSPRIGTWAALRNKNVPPAPAPENPGSRQSSTDTLPPRLRATALATPSRGGRG